MLLVRVRRSFVEISFPHVCGERVMALEIPGRVGIEAVHVNSPNYIPASVPMQLSSSLRIVIAGGVSKRTELARGFLNAMITAGVPMPQEKHIQASVTIALAIADELLRQSEGPSEECPPPTPPQPLPAETDATGILLP
jgi:hypothetical protein